MQTQKKVTLNFVGMDGNAFILMGAFRKHARLEGWTNQEIQVVIDECMAGNYDHLLQTLLRYTKDPSDQEYPEDTLFETKTTEELK